MKDLNKRVGEVIRKLREQQGLTQDQFAEAAGVHEKHVGRMERGIQGITLEYLCKVADGLKISAADLVSQILENQEKDESKERVLKEIQSFLKNQSMSNLKSLRQIIYQFGRSDTPHKSVLLLEAKKTKRDQFQFVVKKILNDSDKKI